MSGGPQVVFIPLRGCLFYGLGLHGIHHHQNHHPHRSESQIGIRVAPVSAKWRVHMQAQTIPSQKFHIDTQNRSCCLKEVTNFQGPSFWGIWLLVFGGAPTFCPKEFHLKVGVFFNPFQHGGSSCLQKSKHVFFCFPGGFFCYQNVFQLRIGCFRCFC